MWHQNQKTFPNDVNIMIFELCKPLKKDWKFWTYKINSFNTLKMKYISCYFELNVRYSFIIEKSWKIKKRHFKNATCIFKKKKDLQSLMNNVRFNYCSSLFDHHRLTTYEQTWVNHSVRQHQSSQRDFRGFHVMTRRWLMRLMMNLP